MIACDSWWEQFEAVVLDPDKDQIKALKEEQKDCEEQMDADPAPSGARFGTSNRVRRKSRRR